MGEREPLADVLKADAEVFAEAVEEKFGVQLPYDVAGVEWLHRFLLSRREDLDRDTFTGIVDLAGSYLGQCLIEVHDGEWVERGEHAKVQLAPDREVDPFWMAESQLRYRDVYSVITLFEAAPRIARVQVGGLYTVAEDAGHHVVVKVLAVDHLGVHLRQYTNRYDAPPEALDPDELSLDMNLEALKAGGDVALGIGHFPIAHDGFWEMDPVLLQVTELEDSELEGYRIWLTGNPLDAS